MTTNGHAVFARLFDEGVDMYGRPNGHVKWILECPSHRAEQSPSGGRKAGRLNRLYYGDNLNWLPEIHSESVDLIYLDPPFNSKRAYNAIFRGADGKESAAQVQVFNDYWEWTPAVNKTYEELVGLGSRGHRSPEKLVTFIEAIRRLLGDNNMAAYLVMMAARMSEMWRVLKPTGSLYLHCDPTASHYLKLVMDAVFGPENFRNEIIWKRTGSHNSADRFGPVHDVILFYGKTTNVFWHPELQGYSEKYEKKFSKVDEKTGKRFRDVSLEGPGVRHGDSGKPWRGTDVTAKGRHWQPATYVYTKYREITGDDLGKYPLLERLDRLDEVGLIYWPKKAGGVPAYKLFREDAAGVPLQDVWTDVDAVNSQAIERIGYPTQKPLALLERIIKSSSRAGDVVLDPFCGCGTAIEAAEKLGRAWIGVDITYLAVPIIRRRLKAYPDVSYKLLGLPADLESAMALASDEDKYQFQWWGVDQIGAMPVASVIPMSRVGKKGSDKGVDGVIRFKEHPNDAISKRIIVSVKTNKVLNPAMVRELRGTMEREKAPIGVFLSAYEPTAQMRSEAAAAGTYRPEGSKRAYQRIQLISAADIFNGKAVDFPGQNVTEDEAASARRRGSFRRASTRVSTCTGGRTATSNGFSSARLTGPS